MIDNKTAAATLLKSGFSSDQAAAILAVIATNTHPVQASASAPIARQLRTFEQVASDSQNLAQVRQLLAMAKRFNVTIDSAKPMDMGKLDAELSASRASVDDRLRFKTSLAQLNLIA
jgi:chorismate mutase